MEDKKFSRENAATTPEGCSWRTGQTYLPKGAAHAFGVTWIDGLHWLRLRQHVYLTRNIRFYLVCCARARSDDVQALVTILIPQQGVSLLHTMLLQPRCCGDI